MFQFEFRDEKQKEFSLHTLNLILFNILNILFFTNVVFYTIFCNQYAIKTIIEKLPHDQKEVIMMRYFLDMSFKEIADFTGVSVNTTLGRMRYAITNLRKVIEKNKIYLPS